MLTVRGARGASLIGEGMTVSAFVIWRLNVTRAGREAIPGLRAGVHHNEGRPEPAPPQVPRRTEILCRSRGQREDARSRITTAKAIGTLAPLRLLGERERRS